MEKKNNLFFYWQNLFTRVIYIGDLFGLEEKIRKMKLSVGINQTYGHGIKSHALYHWAKRALIFTYHSYDIS